MDANRVTIPLCQLKASKLNMRKTDRLADIDQLAASIEANGILENLVVHPLTNGTKDAPATVYEVVAGGRRLAALQRLAKAKKIEPVYPVPCLVMTDASAGTLTEISLTENFVRMPAHPADQFEAFAKLHGQGMSADDVAARFGVATIFVLQRLKLAAVSPRLVAQYRGGAMTLEQLTAFTVSDDRKAQEGVWFDGPYEAMPVHLIRRLLTQTQVDASDRRALFIGVKAYEAAGGVIARDLFDLEHQGYLTDSQLLDRLVTEKLQAAGENVRREGWAWVEVESELGYSARLRGIEPVEVLLSEDEEKKLATTSERYDVLVALIEDEGDNAAEEELDRIAAELEEFRLRKESWSEEDRARAGAVIGLNHDGTLSVQRGLLRPEESGDSAQEPATKATIAKKAAGPYSEAVLVDLSAHRTAALREAVARRPDAAVLALLWSLVASIFFGRRAGCLEINAHQADLERASETVGDGKAAKLFAKRHAVLAKRLPPFEGLWDWLETLPETERLELLSYCVATAINAIHNAGHSEERVAGSNGLATLVGLDMAEWWKPTEGFLRRLAKAEILASVTEGASAKSASRLSEFKKDRMAKEAEKLLVKGGWLPGPLRAPANTEHFVHETTG